jgi:hypothetical protein
MSMRDCSKCEHRAELNPEFEHMDWAEIPCSHCDRPTVQDDRPTLKTVLIQPELLDRLPFHGIPARPFSDARKADLLGKLIRRAVADPVDGKIIRHILDKPGDTQAEASKALGMKLSAFQMRINRLRK